MNSAGMAVLIQALRMTAPRAIELVLVGPTAAVVRPLQLSGLWHRFTSLERRPKVRAAADRPRVAGRGRAGAGVAVERQRGCS